MKLICQLLPFAHYDSVFFTQVFLSCSSTGFVSTQVTLWQCQPGQGAEGFACNPCTTKPCHKWPGEGVGLSGWLTPCLVHPVFSLCTGSTTLSPWFSLEKFDSMHMCHSIDQCAATCEIAHLWNLCHKYCTSCYPWLLIWLHGGGGRNNSLILNGFRRIE